jgi:hypothetical protein
MTVRAANPVHLAIVPGAPRIPLPTPAPDATDPPERGQYQ